MSRKTRHAARKQAPPTAPAGKARAETLVAAAFQEAVNAHHARDLVKAEAGYRAVLRVNPRNLDALNNLGVLLKGTGRIADAIACYQAIIAAQPVSPFAYNNLSCALVELGRLDEALDAARKSVEQKPDYAEGFFNLGTVLRQLGRNDDAIAAFGQAIRLKADFAAPWNNLGEVLKGRSQLAQAVQCFASAVRLNPRLVEAYNNLGEVLKDQGRYREARDIFLKGLEIDPGYAIIRSNLVFLENYDPELAPEQVFADHREWDRLYAAPLAPAGKRFANRPDPGKRLRIGYVSPDFCSHSVSFFIEPVLERRDRAGFEVFCYSNGRLVDAATERLRAGVDGWREIDRLGDEAVARQIEADGIDILVDLAGHTANHRLLVFARRPAPVQATWIGYPNTTGLKAIDYRLTDAVTDPVGASEHLHAEELWRLPQGFLCYRPLADAPPVSPLPARAAGAVTFGSFNNLAKVTPQVLATWARILNRVPGSRLLLKCKQLADAETRERVLAALAGHGVDGARVQLLGAVNGQSEHLAVYGQVDIGLDPVPYNGTTTTCESLWMGVPVVALLGRTHVARVSASLNLQVGLGHLVAPDPDGYVETAVALAGDLVALADLRAGLRARMQASSLCDAAGFTRRLEEAYRAMWRRWCAAAERQAGSRLASPAAAD